MTQEEMWCQYQKWIMKKANEFHKKFPLIFEFHEKLSIAWECANRARKTFDESKGKFTTYSGRAMHNGLIREINKEIKSKIVQGEDPDFLPREMILLDEKIDKLQIIRRSKAGKWVYYNKVYGISVEKLAKEEKINPQKIWKNIRNFRQEY